MAVSLMICCDPSPERGARRSPHSWRPWAGFRTSLRLMPGSARRSAAVAAGSARHVSRASAWPCLITHRAGERARSVLAASASTSRQELRVAATASAGRACAILGLSALARALGAAPPYRIVAAGRATIRLRVASARRLRLGSNARSTRTARAAPAWGIAASRPGAASCRAGLLRASPGRWRP